MMPRPGSLSLHSIPVIEAPAVPSAVQLANRHWEAVTSIHLPPTTPTLVHFADPPALQQVHRFPAESLTSVPRNEFAGVADHEMQTFFDRDAACMSSLERAQDLHREVTAPGCWNDHQPSIAHLPGDIA